MWDWLNVTTMQAAIACSLVLIIGIAGFRFLKRLRPSTCKADTNATDWIADFAEMQREGGINEREFRLIKQELGKRDSDFPAIARRGDAAGKA